MYVNIVPKLVLLIQDHIVSRSFLAHVKVCSFLARVLDYATRQKSYNYTQKV